jgi:hypothetical protein
MSLSSTARHAPATAAAAAAGAEDVAIPLQHTGSVYARVGGVNSPLFLFFTNQDHS